LAAQIVEAEWQRDALMIQLAHAARALCTVRVENAIMQAEVFGLQHDDDVALAAPASKPADDPM
jgi:hypothetical protein